MEIILVDSSKLFVPIAERRAVLDILHHPHQGINRTLAHAKRLFFWRGMKEQVSKLISSCSICVKYQKSKSQIEEVENADPCTHPMFHFCLDLFTHNSSQYSVGVNEFSGMFWIQKFTSIPTTESLTAYLKKHPCIFRTEDSGQMRHCFEQWCNNYNIKVEKFSAFNPISNSCSESHIQVAKQMLDTAKQEKIHVEEALSALRSCPSSVECFSPARIFYGRDLRHPELPDISDGQDEELLGKERQVKKEEARVKRNSHVSKTIQIYTPQVRDLIYLQDRRTLKWNIPATVQLVRPGGRSAYCLTEDDEALYLCSHVYMRPRNDFAAPTDAAPVHILGRQRERGEI